MAPGTAARVVLAAAAAGLALRLAFGFVFWTGKPLTHDEREYLRMARNVAAGRGFVDDPAPPPDPGQLAPERFGRPPGYPVFIALATGLGRALPATGEPEVVPASLKIVQAVAGAIAVLLIAAVARRVAGDTAGVIAAILAAVHPPLVWIAGYALTEGIYWVLGLTAVLLLAPITDEPSPTGGRWRTVLAGMVVGLAALTRPATIVFAALVAIWLLWRRHLRLAVAFAIGVALMVLPWTARNAATHGRFVLIASEGGITFWTGNHPLAVGEGDMAANTDIKRANLELRSRYADLSPEALEPVYYREALKTIAARPWWWLGLEARKFFYTWVPIGPSYTLHSRLYYVTTLVSYGLLAVLGFAGFWPVWRRGRRPYALWLLAGSVVLVCLIFFPQERFRIPVIDPALIVCAAGGFALGRRDARTP